MLRYRNNRSYIVRCCLVTVALSLLAAKGSAEQAVGWRGDGTGRYPDAQPATRWSVTDNVLWKAALPSTSNSSPIIVGDRLFTCGEPDTLFCLDTKDGRIAWERRSAREDTFSPAERNLAERLDRERLEFVKTTADPLRKRIAEASRVLRDLQAKLDEKPDDATLQEQVSGASANKRLLDKELLTVNTRLAELSPFALPHKSDIGGYSSPTPASDGKCVYVTFGTGMAACYDLQGERRWSRFVGHPKSQYGHSASPVLLDGAVFVHVDEMLALRAETGEVVWSKPLPAGFGTPAVGQIGKEAFLLLPKGRAVRAKDGETLAWNGPALEFASPTICDAVAYFIQNGGGACRLSPAAGKEGIELLWKTSPKKQRYYASPLVHEGLVYTITEQGNLSVIDASDGKVVYTEAVKVNGAVFSNITLAGPYLFFTSERGTTVAFKPGRKYEEVARNTLEPQRSTPVFVGKRMYVRTLKAVYCIGEK